MTRLATTPKRVMLVLAAAVAAVAFVVLANHGTARPATGSATVICKETSYAPNQPIVIAKVDATASTQNEALRSQYTHALDAVAAAASASGAYLVVDTFGADPTKTKTICATSTRVAGAAPLFVTARATELRRALGQVAQQASNTNAGASGSAVFGALADGVEQVRELLPSSSGTPAAIVVISDGDEAADGTHLRLLLESGATNTTIVNRVVGRLAPPDARGMAIQLEGIGRAGIGRPISTTGARRMVLIWKRICARTHPERCGVTTDLLNTLSFGRR